VWTHRIAADVWVLTETHDSFSPGLPFSCSSAAGRDGLHQPAHRWVTIWSSHRLEPLATNDPERTAATRVFCDVGPPFLVYGTVLPWIGSKWRNHPTAGGFAFREALKVQVSDWASLRLKFPTDELFVLGDFNQDLVQPRYYGSKVARAALNAGLGDVGLIALTAGAGDPIRRDSAPFACIDHICALRDSRWSPEPAVRWPDLPRPEKRLSDHFGVAVKFTPRAPSTDTEVKTI
jgi:hypothetical protein